MEKRGEGNELNVKTVTLERNEGRKEKLQENLREELEVIDTIGLKSSLYVPVPPPRNLWVRIYKIRMTDTSE